MSRHDRGVRSSLDTLRVCAFSVDLDEIPHYHAIHGLAAPGPPSETAVYDIAVERLGRFAEEHQIPLTFFAAGADLRRAQSASGLRTMASRGHEIANHSFDHRYDLTRLDRESMCDQVERAARIIEETVGERPVGFRSPGYVMTDELAEVLIGAGVGYDSSVFPCPAYLVAKAVARGLIALRGRSSGSIQDHPRVLLAPVRPYRMGNPYYRAGDGPLIEFPIQVAGAARVPWIGTTLILFGAKRARWLTKSVIGEPVVNLELHGIDVLDSGDGLGALAPSRPDVRLSHQTKLETLGEVVRVLKAEGYGFGRLSDVAALVRGML